MARDDSRTITFGVGGPIERADLPGLCERVCALMTALTAERRGGVIECVVAGVEPNLPTVEALARLAVLAHKRGCRVRLRDASPALRELVSLLGLDEVF